MCEGSGEYGAGMRTHTHGTILAAGFAVVLACVVVGLAGMRVQAWAAEACPNASVLTEQAGLLGFPAEGAQSPECRGFELVSPPFKGGYPIAGVTAISSAGLVAISRDGSRVIGQSIGAFAGSASDTGFGAFYELTRGGSGWVASPIAPSPARFPFQKLVVPSTDLTRSVWALREPSQSIYAQDLYLREQDGSFVKVGPMVSPSVASGPTAGYYDGLEGEAQFAGASGDLSHVLFTIATRGKYWSFDTTNETTAPSSLYEYSGIGSSEPALVGVAGSAGDHTLISQCGTVLGAEHSNDTYNAVSTSGATVYFTAEHKSAAECPGGTQPAVNELYARLDGSETVAISEPTSSQCAECSTASRSAAAFQGASADGSKVFFTTAQELLPGQTGDNLYEYDLNNPAGRKVVLVSTGSPNPEVQGVARVSDNGSHVYFVAQGKLVGRNAEQREPQEGKPNLYVFERSPSRYAQGHTAFIATLGTFDGKDWSEGDSRPVQTTPDGRFLAFESEGDLTPDDSSTVEQVFEYDALQEKLVRVSVGHKSPGGYECPTTHVSEEGYNCNGNTEVDAAEIPAPGYSLNSAPTSAESSLAVSSDGSYVFFTSSDGLTPRAQFTNNHVINTYEERQILARNVYEYHSTVGIGGSVGAGNVYLISDGRDLTLSGDESSGVGLYGTDALGDDVFFRSGDPLIAQDSDTQLDVYDARVDGGFPAPVSPVGCEGEACLGGPSAAPLFSRPASSSTVGGGNLTPPMEAKPPPKAKVTKPKSLTRVQKLANALKACRKKPRRKRAACKAKAKRKYGKHAGKSNATKSDRRTR